MLAELPKEAKNSANPQEAPAIPPESPEELKLPLDQQNAPPEPSNTSEEVVSLEGDWDRGGSAPAWSGVCGFLTLCRKDFRPGEFESMSIKAGDSETKERLKLEEVRCSNRSEPRWSCLGPLERKSHRQKK